MASDDRGGGWWDAAGRLGIVSRWVVLGVVLGVAWLLAWLISLGLAGDAWFKASVAAAVICWVSGANVALFGSLIQSDQQALIKVVFGLLVRMVLPLAGGIWLIRTEDWAEKGGLAFYLIAFYQVMLATETTLDVAYLQAASRDKKDDQNPPAG